MMLAAGRVFGACVVGGALLVAGCSSGGGSQAIPTSATTTAGAATTTTSDGTATTTSKPADGLTAEQLNAHLGVGVPKGWVPVDDADARVWVPSDWELEPQGAGFCDSAVGKISIGHITNPHCDAAEPMPTPSQAVALFPMSRTPSSNPLLTVHGYRIYRGTALRWAFDSSSYIVPQLGVEIAAWGTLSNRILDTLAPSARRIALDSTHHAVPNDSHSFSESGVSMSIPPSWGIPTPTPWGCGGWPSYPAMYLVNPDALVGDCGIYTQPLDAATHDGIALFLPSRDGRNNPIGRPIATVQHGTTTITIGVDPVRRTSRLCRVSGVGVADLVLVGGGRAIAQR
jgi:hypothetical protein